MTLARAALAAIVGASTLTATLACAETMRPDRRPHQFEYRSNPAANYVWSKAGSTFLIGNWGSTPHYYPYAQVWSSSGHPQDLACNMPSSPCWNQDRE
jgi:hypothetical protein